MKESPANIPTLPDELDEIGYGDSFKETLCDMLEQVPLFQHSSRQDIEQIAEFVHAYHAPPRCRILVEGQHDQLLWFVVEGKLDVYKEAEGQETKKLVTIRAGKTIGEMSMIDGQPHSASVVTATDCTLLLLTRNNFVGLAEHNPRLGLNITWKLAQLLSQRLRQTSGKLIDHL